MSDLGVMIAAVLKSAAKQTVNSAFDNFLDKKINIAPGIRSTASASHNHLRDFLASVTKKDEGFPRVLSKNDTDFLGGSFARHTKIWPLDDIDVYVPLDGHNLVYLQGGTTLPYTVISDGVLQSNPLLSQRWMNGNYISSRRLINEFVLVLKEHYSRSEVRPDGQAVRISTKIGETEEADGIGFDVVPCFSLKAHDGSHRFYLIPDGSDSWIRTNPRIDEILADDLNSKNGKTYRKAVKLVKYWNDNALGGRVRSYYIELSIAKEFLRLNGKGSYVTTISEGVMIAFRALDSALAVGDQSSLVQGAPAVKPGTLEYLDSLLVAVAKTQAQEAYDYETIGMGDDALKRWRKVFGDVFGQ
jgi:hypothetical protein